MTGAGISAESGIPTFRGEEGYWTVGSRNFHPTELATRQAFSEVPDDVWCWYLFRRGVCNQALPNAGHEALARMEESLGDRFLLVTQNVDSLHERAGNSPKKIFEVHGNINFMRCWAECNLNLWRIPQGVGPKARGVGLSDEERELLVCPECGGRARPHVLWFDECYDEAWFRYDSSMNAVKRCGALVTVGSSGTTNLPMRMASVASGSGAILIDINPETNPFSRLAQASGGVWLKRPAGAALNDLRELL